MKYYSRLYHDEIKQKIRRITSDPAYMQLVQKRDFVLKKVKAKQCQLIEEKKIEKERKRRDFGAKFFAEMYGECIFFFVLIFHIELRGE